MRAPYIEGVATHDDPESCAGGREAAREALTGGTYGQGIEPRNQVLRGADAVIRSGRPHSHRRHREAVGDPARSETPRTYGFFLRGSREIPRSLVAPAAGRIGKAEGRTPMMHGRGKSDGGVVPTKSPNKAGSSAAKEMEGRPPAEGNTGQQNASRTQSRSDAPSALDRVRHLATKDRKAKFTALLHPVTVDRLRAAFRALERKAAAGVDGVTWQQYAAALEDNLRDLHARLHRGAYRAKPSRRVFLPKPDGRPGRSQHHALDALATAVLRKKVNWVLDADLRDFYGSIDRGWLQRFVAHRIADRRILRLIPKWLSAGVLQDGTWTASEQGTPPGRGGVVPAGEPLLALRLGSLDPAMAAAACERRGDRRALCR
jgi:RNA-directed DNA polymerase